MQSSHSSHPTRQGLVAREQGVALIVTLLIMMLVSALMVGFVAAVVADQRASGLDRDQTQAYAAAHAGMEKLTADLNALFTADFSPNATQLGNLRTTPPTIPGFSFVAPGGGSGSGYWVEARKVDGSGNPLPENSTTGSPITAGPYQGFTGIITPYDITITARSTGLGGAEVRMRRTLQTVAIPVFQFGMFSETDLSFHAGDDFVFGGRVHTNGNLFLAAADSSNLTITDRITAVGEVIRKKLPNGLDVTSGYEGNVRIPTTIAQNQASNVYRNLLTTEGSLTGTIPKTLSPSNVNSVWYGLSTGTYKSNIRNGTTGAKRLDLPLVADLNSDGVPDAQPIELIRRPPTGPPYENVTTPFIYTQRYYAQAGLRILLSDSSAEITGLPTIYTATAPINLGAGGSYGPLLMQSPIAKSVTTPGSAESGVGATQPAGFQKSDNQVLINGWIKIEALKNDGTYIDVTADILNLGISGRNLADAGINTPSTYPITTSGTPLKGAWNRVGTACAEPHPNAVIRLQRVRDVPKGATGATPSNDLRCGIVTLAGVQTGVAGNATDYWPLALYDTREGQTRDGTTTAALNMGGIMQYIELDVNNLRRWLAGTIGTQGTLVKNDNGYIVYFSDRRNNKNTAATPKETGEYGFEDVINLTNTAGTPNTTLDTGEDVNASGALDTYGATPRNALTGALCPYAATGCTGTNGPPAPFFSLNTFSAADGPMIARANPTVFFRRALKIVNGGLGNLPTSGLTIVSENPVYLQGNYNATATSVTGTTNVPAAIIADALTMLSNNWNDIRSFVSPNDASQRVAGETGYRVALVVGKTNYFPQPSGTSSSFGSDGGAHNFTRLLEDWSGTTHHYRGSMVSFFISRQAIGSFKCCSNDAYTRGARDWSFDTDFLNPTKLPPGTPMFRDVNTLTFRQLLRPTQ